jgi:hypothetical protein
MSLSPLASVTNILTIPAGLVVCFFGYRIAKAIVGIAGYFVGAVGGAALGGANHWSPGLVLAATIGSGLICACLAMVLSFAGIFILGVAGFYLLSTLFLHNPPAIVGIAIAGGIATVMWQKFMLMVTTALGGASAVVSAIVALAHGMHALGMEDPSRSLEGPHRSHEGSISLLVALCLGAAGLVVQMAMARSRKHAEE